MNHLNPCVCVILGATGDLASKKLFPSIYNLAKSGGLSNEFVCVGFARRDKSNSEFRAEMKNAVKHFAAEDFDIKAWESIEEKIFYHRSNFYDDEGYKSLKIFLESIDQKYHTKGNRLFYLSTPHTFFPVVIEKLNSHKLIYDESVKDKFSQVIIEKPFGTDLEDAKALKEQISTHLNESQIYRIDHYLGKEAIQNIPVLRFSNPIIDACWNNQYVDHVQITASESIGIGTRGNSFEESGSLRDFFQNHMLQILALVAMDKPKSLSPDHIQDEKVKVLRSLRKIKDDEFNINLIRGQYGPGTLGGERIKGYRQEDNVSPTSTVETFIAVKTFIDTPRWEGVPFYLRAGKRLTRKHTEVAIVLKKPEGNLFTDKEVCSKDNNVIVFDIQPIEVTSITCNKKVIGDGFRLEELSLSSHSSDADNMLTGYEKLIYNSIAGNGTLFTRYDEVLASWEWCDPILKRWQTDTSVEFPNYAAGSIGPDAAVDMMTADGRAWRHM